MLGQSRGLKRLAFADLSLWVGACRCRSERYVQAEAALVMFNLVNQKNPIGNTNLFFQGLPERKKGDENELKSKQRELSYQKRNLNQVHLNTLSKGVCS